MAILQHDYFLGFNYFKSERNIITNEQWKLFTAGAKLSHLKPHWSYINSFKEKSLHNKRKVRIALLKFKELKIIKLFHSLMRGLND